jgi:hypothetical protein
MTSKSDLAPEQWKLISEGPVVAGLLVLRAHGGGTFRETFAMARAYGDARKQHGESQLLDELASSKPEIDRHRFHSDQELHDRGLQELGEAAALLREHATEQEAADYRDFVLAVAQRVAAAHREDGQEVSPSEQAAINEIRGALEHAGRPVA